MTAEKITVDQAWDKYRSCYAMGGTSEQKRFAFNRWWALERRCLAEERRAEKRAKAKAVRG